MEKVLYMEKDYEEEVEVIVAPYYVITYVDDWNKTHIAMIKDTLYLQFLKDRFYVKECKYIEE